MRSSSVSAFDVVMEAAATLGAAGLVSPGADARVLVAYVLGVDVKQMLTAPALTTEQSERVAAMVARRLEGEPVQHLTGEAHFRYETLRVGPGVFIPRPETEQLVDLALERLARRPVGRRCVVELCAGSGAITLSLARELGGLELHAVELSEHAWPYLAHNLEGIPVDLVRGDMSEAFGELAGVVDMLVVNPPYVPERMRDQLPADVVGRDPDLALFSGQDGLEALRVVRRRAVELLRPGGWVIAEHDESHADRVATMFGEPWFDDTRTVPDLAGRPRHVVARRRVADDVAGLGA